jgi:MSHA pilin protein MshD
MTTAEQNYRLLQEIEANRRFLLMAYQQNPKLLESAEARIRQLFDISTPLGWGDTRKGGRIKQRGISLIELIMFIVIVSVSLVGILLVMNQVTAHSADPLIRKQALAIAESMLEEIKLQNLSGVACAGVLAQNAARSGVSAVCDYKGYSTAGGIKDFSTNTTVAGLEGYNITGVAVTRIVDLPTPALGGTAIVAGSGVEITVTVTDPIGGVISATGYRAGN